MLLAIGLILLYTTTTTARLRRESRINRLRENAEIAYYAAESGFNRARARVITKGENAGVLALHNTGETLPGGATYALTITGDSTAGYRIESTGTYGAGEFQATRFVKGLVTVAGPTGDGLYYRVQTQYER